MLGPKLNKIVAGMRKSYCPKCKYFSKKKDCPFFEMCVVSLHSLGKKKPIHFMAAK